MINFVRALTFIIALVITISSIFYIDSEQELAKANQAFRAGDMDQTIRLSRRSQLTSSDKNNRIKAFYLQAKAAVKMNWIEKAKFYLDQALSLDSENVNVLLFRGKINQLLGKSNDALGDFNKGLSLASENYSINTLAFYHTQRGLTHINLNNINEAENDAIKALELKENLPEAHDLMSKVFEQKGNIKKSLEECELAYQLFLKRDNRSFMTAEGRELSNRLVELKIKNLQAK